MGLARRTQLQHRPRRAARRAAVAEPARRRHGGVGLEASIQGRSFACPSCGAPPSPQTRADQEPRLRPVRCRGRCTRPRGQGARLHRPAPGRRAADPARPHRPAQRDPSRPAQPWQVVGYQERCDLPDDAGDEQTFWREYLLFNQMEGFAFLVDTQEGWSLVGPLTGAPSTGRGGVARWAGTSFKPRWEQPYRAKGHPRARRVLLARASRPEDPRHRLRLQATAPTVSAEATRDKVTWSHFSRVLPAEEVRRAFSCPSKRPAPTLRVTPAPSARAARLLHRCRRSC